MHNKERDAAALRTMHSFAVLASWPHARLLREVHPHVRVWPDCMESAVQDGSARHDRIARLATAAERAPGSMVTVH